MAGEFTIRHLPRRDAREIANCYGGRVGGGLMIEGSGDCWEGTVDHVTKAEGGETGAGFPGGGDCHGEDGTAAYK